MKKIITSFLFAFAMIVSMIAPVSAQVDQSKLYSKYAYVYDVTSHQTLMNMNGNARIYPASMTKMMTVFTAIRLINNLDAKVTIKNDDIKDQYALDASSANLVKGQKVTYLDLLYGAMYPSGADACWALARTLSGNEANFVKEMNADAKRLGMTHTHFNTSTGLPDKTHYTTCEDIAKLMEKAYQNATWRKVFTAGDHSYYKPKGGNQIWMSTLTRMRVRLKTPSYSAILGAKSGFTKDAMYCLGSLSMVHGHLVATVTGKADPTKQKKLTLACALEDHNRIVKDIDDNYKSVTLYQVGQVVKTFKIHMGELEHYTYRMGETYKILVDKNFDESTLKTTFTGASTLEAPVKKGTKLGTLKVTTNGTKLVEVTIYSGIDIVKSKQKTYIYYGIRIACVVSVIWVLWRMIHSHRLKKKYKKRKAMKAKREKK